MRKSNICKVLTEQRYMRKQRQKEQKKKNPLRNKDIKHLTHQEIKSVQALHSKATHRNINHQKNKKMYQTCTCYSDVLGLNAFKEYTDEEITKAYRKIALTIHPDKWQNSNANRYMQIINKAKEVLIEINHNEFDKYEEMENHNCEEFEDAEYKIKQLLKEKEPADTQEKEPANTPKKPNIQDILISDSEDDYPIFAQEIPKPKQNSNSPKKKESKAHIRRNSLQNVKAPPGRKLEKIISHIVHNKGLKFQFKWEGISIKTDGPLKIALDNPKQLKEYMTRLKKESPRKHSFLIKTYPEIINVYSN